MIALKRKQKYEEFISINTFPLRLSHHYQITFKKFRDKFRLFPLTLSSQSSEKYHPHVASAGFESPASTWRQKVGASTDNYYHDGPTNAHRCSRSRNRNLFRRGKPECTDKFQTLNFWMTFLKLFNLAYNIARCKFKEIFFRHWLFKCLNNMLLIQQT